MEYGKLLEDVIKDLIKDEGRCSGYTKECDLLLKEYVEGVPLYCTHKCEYCVKFRWIIDRARHYSEKLNIPFEEILQSWEEDRDFWYMNYYQEANQPMIDSDNVFVFENIEELREKCGNEFICPCCNGISTDPYECNSGKMIKRGDLEKVCDWKAYGFLQFDLAYIYIKSKRKGTKCFMPTALKEN